MMAHEIDCRPLANEIAEMLKRRLQLAGFDATIEVCTENIWAKFGIEVKGKKEWWHIDTGTIGTSQSDLLLFVDRLALKMVDYFRAET